VGKRQAQEAFDIDIVESKYALMPSEWLLHNPQARADDLMFALQDESIKGIFSIIGGKDALSIVPYCDIKIIRQYPKIFVGNSDSTTIHWMFGKAGVQSYYGTSIMTGMAENNGMLEYTIRYIDKVLFGAHKECVVHDSGMCVDEYLEWSNRDNQVVSRQIRNNSWRVLQGQGCVQGELWGGCPEVIAQLQHTSLMPNVDFWYNKVLFLEVSEEMPSREWFEHFVVDVFGYVVLSRLSAIVCGRPNTASDIYTQVLQQVLSRYNLEQLPLIVDMDFGHTQPSCVLPYGRRCSLDIRDEQVEFVLL
jgi:muramoyltetrapeptide carboxypeptidase LdcA involved in peptidoglycan recycling